jgi:hexosaminidase
LSLAALVLSAPAALIPLPKKVEWREGFFTLDRQTALVEDGRSPNVAARLREALALPLPSRRSESGIRLRRVPGLKPEAYVLEVDPKKIEIRASDEAGLFYGVQTLRQLAKGGKVPACAIEDGPRFRWRGLLLDDSRHFFGPKFARKFIDTMAAHKLNVFHWHLTDDGGWRMETKRYPELTSIGAWRKEQGVEWDYGNLWFPGPASKERLYGGYYPQKELKAIVRYAQDRNVTIVPEIEMPGHSLAATASHPELQCDPPPGVMKDYLERARSQAPTMICPGKDSTIEFCKRVLDETMEIFPSKFIHIGGDEVDKTLWRQCRSCQARMKANGLKDENELQSWFIRQMDAYLASKGRRLIGWDEILEGGLAPGATVMSWRGIEGGIAAAKSGHDVVMSPTSHCYLDYSYETIPTSKIYDYEPIPADLVSQERERVLGGQGNVWTEWLSSPQEVEEMTYPRAAALAETLWTMPDRKNWADFETRLGSHYALLQSMGVAFRMEAPRLEVDVLNLEAANDWRAAAPPLPGSKIVLEDGTDVTGKPLPTAPGEYRLFVQRTDGVRSAATTARVVRLSRDPSLVQPGLRKIEIPWKGETAPLPSAFSGGAATVVDSPSVPKTAPDPVAILFEGGLVVETPGRYTLKLGSDDGSVLYINGQKVVSNDGQHPYVEATATVDLLAGTYPMQLVYFDSGGGRRLTLSCSRAGQPIAPIARFVH